MLPELSDLLKELEEIADSGEIDPGMKVIDLDVDSLDLLEWLFTVADRYALNVDETVLDNAGDLTLVELWERVKERHAAIADA